MEPGRLLSLTLKVRKMMQVVPEAGPEWQLRYRARTPPDPLDLAQAKEEK